MLVKASLEDIEKYGEFVYELAINQEKSCYPTYADGIKTKEDFFREAKKAIESDTGELLLYFHENKAEGWIQYFWIEKDHYLQVSGCNIDVGMQQALEELLILFKERFQGYEFYFGCADVNVEAIEFLKRNAFTCIEEDYNNSFFFEDYELRPESKNVREISRDNFEDFCKVHAPIEENTYWNCERVLAKIDSWKIYVYYEKEEPVGAIFFDKNGEYREIVGLEFLEGKYSKERFQSLLERSLNEGKRSKAKYLTFLCEEEEQMEEKLCAMKELGFVYVGKYVCYLKKLRKFEER